MAETVQPVPAWTAQQSPLPPWGWPQVPFTQLLGEQQSVLLTQEPPLGWQTGAFAQTPFRQELLQQSVFAAHPAPSWAHASEHWLFVHVLPLQHSALTLQKSPSWWQAWQVPCVQMLEQQSLASVHVSLSILQEPQVPW
jgi:hypothetical protein